jgi:hypothetical protein
MDQFLEMLPPAVYLSIAGVITALAVITRFVKLKPAIQALIDSLHMGAVTYEQVDKAVEDLLRKGGDVTPFIDWVSDVIATLATEMPSWKELDNDVRIGLIAALFSKLRRTRAVQLININDGMVISTAEARRALARSLLKSLDKRLALVGGR